MLKWIFLCFNLCPLLLVLTGHYREESGSTFFASPHVHIDKSHWLFSRLNSSSSLSLSPYVRCPISLVARMASPLTKVSDYVLLSCSYNGTTVHITGELFLDLPYSEHKSLAGPSTAGLRCLHCPGCFPSLLSCRRSLSQPNGHLQCNVPSVLELPTSLSANIVEYSMNKITKKRFTNLFLKWL